MIGLIVCSDKLLICLKSLNFGSMPIVLNLNWWKSTILLAFAPVKVHPDLFELISLGLDHSLAPKSHLNISIGPLVQTWRIGFSDAKVANSEEIASALALIDPHFIKLDSVNSTVFLEKKGMKIDLGCLAKGYSADKVAIFLKENGVTSALINLGGNILTIGNNQAKKRSTLANRHSRSNSYTW